MIVNLVLGCGCISSFGFHFACCFLLLDSVKNKLMANQCLRSIIIVLVDVNIIAYLLFSCIKAF